MASNRFLSNVFRRYDETVAPPKSLAAETIEPPRRVTAPPSSLGTIAGIASIDGHFALKQPAGLLVIGWLADGSDQPVTGHAQIGTQATLKPAWSFRYRRQDVATHLGATPGAPNLHGFVAFFPLTETPATRHARFELTAGGKTSLLEADLDEPGRDAIDVLHRVWEEARESLLKALDPLPGELLCALPAVAMPPSLKFCVDHCLELPEGHFISGWLAALDGEEPQVYLVDETERSAVQLSDRWARTQRTDVAEALKVSGAPSRSAGFVALAPIAAKPTHLFSLYLCMPQGCVHFPLAVQAPTDWRAATTTVLGSFKMTHRRLAAAISDHIGPALAGLVAERADAATPEVSLRWFGTPPEKPAASVIIPLWRSADLVRNQIAAFGAARGGLDWELIFAIDDPELEEPVLNRAEDWLALYGRPFAVASWDRNVGLLRALNLAATQARGDVIVFMHSDVIVDSPDWLQHLLGVFTRLPDCGIVGPKLLYEDGMVQSEGVRRRAVTKAPAFIEPELVRRGLLDRPSGDEPREVDGVSSACMAIRRSLFKALGGFDTGYLLQHEFGELDLCLRAARTGARVLLDPKLTMRHLEGYTSSEFAKTEPFLADAGWRDKIQLCNAWRLAHRLAPAKDAPA